MAVSSDLTKVKDEIFSIIIFEYKRTSQGMWS